MTSKSGDTSVLITPSPTPTSTPTPTATPVDPTYFRVINYGAKGDGVTDDRASIQAALDAAKLVNGTVYFDPGTYHLGSLSTAGDLLYVTGWTAFTINLLGDNATIETSYVGKSILHALGKWTNSFVRGLTFKNTHGLTTTGSAGIYLQGTSANDVKNWTIEGNTFMNFQTAIQTTGVDTITIENNDFIMEKGRDSGTGTNSTLPNVAIWNFDNTPNGNSVRIQILNNRYAGCGSMTDISQTVSKSCGDGFSFGRPTQSLIKGNSIRGFSAEGIAMASALNPGLENTVTENTIDGTMITGDQFGGGLWGIRIENDGAIISSNVIKNAVTGIMSCTGTSCGGTGVNATGLQIYNNTISFDSAPTQIVEVGISLIGVSQSSVWNNTITFNSGLIPTGWQAQGILLTGSSPTLLSDSITATGNIVTNHITGPTGSTAGIALQRLSNWTVTGNTLTGASYGLGITNQTGTAAQLTTLLNGNTFSGNASNYHLTSSSFP